MPPEESNRFQNVMPLCVAAAFVDERAVVIAKPEEKNVHIHQPAAVIAAAILAAPATCITARSDIGIGRVVDIPRTLLKFGFEILDSPHHFGV